MTAQIDLERLNGGPEPKQEPVNIEVVPEARELLRPEQATLLEPADIMVDKAQERAVFRTTRMTNEHGKPQEVASVGIMQDSMGEWFIMPRGTRSGDTAHDITISDQHSLHLPRGMEVLVVDGQATFRTAEGNEKTDPSFLSDPTVQELGRLLAGNGQPAVGFRVNKEGRFEIQNLGQQPAGLTVNEYRPRRSPTGQESKPEHTSISEALGTAGMADKSEVPVASGQIQQGLGTYDQESSLSPTEGALDLAKLNGDEENSPKTALREFDEETKSDKFESKNETMQALIAAVEALPIDQREGQLKASVGVVIEHLEALAYLPEQERRGKTDEIQQSIADMTGLFRAYANETIHDLSALLNNLKESDQTRVNEIISGLHEELEKGAKAGDDLFKEFGESTTIDWNRLQELFGRLKSPFSAQSNARKAIVQLLNRV